jgi:hypothetical protein
MMAQGSVLRREVLLPSASLRRAMFDDGTRGEA